MGCIATATNRVMGDAMDAHAVLEAYAAGALNADEAKRLACEVTGAAHAALLTRLDADGDGEISMEEAEGGARAAFHAAEERVSRLCAALEPHRATVFAIGGYLGTFYGGNFPYTILFSSTFASTGWPTLRPALDELAASYARGKRAFRTNGAALRKAPAVLRRLSATGVADAREAREAKTVFKAGSSLLAAVDPKHVAGVVRSAYVGVAASLASVLSATAAKLGVGAGLGAAVGDAIAALLEPAIKRAIKALDLGDEDDESVTTWAAKGSSFVAGILGAFVAHRLDGVVYVAGASLNCATLCVDSIRALAPTSPLRSPRVRHAAVLTLAATGFAYQRILGHGKLPLPARACLAPVFLAETFLSGIALSSRRHGGF